jgi:hypothetical protein
MLGVGSLTNEGERLHAELEELDVALRPARVLRPRKVVALGR